MKQTFGPVVGIQPVDSPGEAAKIINSQRYSLESYLFSTDPMTIDQLGVSLNVGTVHVNDVPLFCDDYLPVTGRNRNCKSMKGSSKYVF